MTPTTQPYADEETIVLARRVFAALHTRLGAQELVHLRPGQAIDPKCTTGSPATRLALFERELGHLALASCRPEVTSCALVIDHEVWHATELAVCALVELERDDELALVHLHARLYRPLDALLGAIDEEPQT